MLITKLLTGLKSDPELLKKQNCNLILGMTKTQLLQTRKTAQEMKLIEKNSLTKRGEKYILDNPIKKWADEKNPKRPEINMQELKSEKTPVALRRAIRELTKNLIDNAPLKGYPAALQKDVEQCFKIQKEIEKFILKDEVKIPDLFETFQKPPYGLTHSLISILLLNAILKNKNKILIYENGQFCYTFDFLTFDKIIYCSEKFVFKSANINSNSINEISKALNCENNVLSLCKNLYNLFSKLQKYTLETNTLSSDTQKLRTAVLNAKDPLQLFSNTKNIKFALDELKQCYPKNLKSMEDFILTAFNAKNFNELQIRFNKVKEFISNEKLLIFDKASGSIEKICTLVNGKKCPCDWNDLDVADFKLKIKELAREFLKTEKTICTANPDSVTRGLINKVLKLSEEQKNVLIRSVL